MRQSDRSETTRAGRLRRAAATVIVFLLLGFLTSVAVAWALVTTNPGGQVSETNHVERDWVMIMRQSPGRAVVVGIAKNPDSQTQTPRFDDYPLTAWRGSLLIEPHAGSGPPPGWCVIPALPHQPEDEVEQFAFGWPWLCLTSMREYRAPIHITWLPELEGRPRWMIEGSDPFGRFERGVLETDWGYWAGLPLRPIVPGLIGNTIVFAALWGALFTLPLAGWRRLRILLRVTKGRCPRCGYDRRASDERRCPECGTEIDWRPPALSGRLRRYGAATSMAIAVAMGLWMWLFTRTPIISPLHYAAYHGDVDGIRRAIARGADVNSSELKMPRVTQRYAWTPLMLAAHKADEGTVRALIALGAEVDAADHDGKTALHHACTHANLAALDAILEAGADVNAPFGTGGMTTIMSLLRTGTVEVFDRLLAAGLDFDPNRSDEKMTLMGSVGGDHDFMRRLLELGVVPDFGALTYALIRNDLETLRLLIDHGGDPLAVDAGGDTLLHLMAQIEVDHDPVEIGTFILNLGVDIDRENASLFTPLHEAIRLDRTEMVRFLIERGAIVNTTDLWGKTPLRDAIVWGRPEAVRLLLEHGATPPTFDQNMRSQYSNLKPEILEMLGWEEHDEEME